jgi:hypothetical protein
MSARTSTPNVEHQSRTGKKSVPDVRVRRTSRPNLEHQSRTGKKSVRDVRVRRTSGPNFIGDGSYRGAVGLVVGERCGVTSGGAQTAGGAQTDRLPTSPLRNTRLLRSREPGSVDPQGADPCAFRAARTAGAAGPVGRRDPYER